MVELASVCLVIGQLHLSAALSWGDADDSEEPPAPIGRPDLIEMPDLDADDPEALGFR